PVGLRRDLVRELREEAEWDSVDLPRTRVDRCRDHGVGLPRPQALTEDPSRGLRPLPEAVVRLEVNEEAARPGAEDVGGHLRFGLGLYALHQGPGVERDAGVLEEARPVSDARGARDGEGRVVVLGHPVVAIVGLEDDAEAVRRERVADDHRVAIVLELPYPHEVSRGAPRERLHAALRPRRRFSRGGVYEA